MAGAARTSSPLKMIPLPEDAPVFRPGKDYLSISLVTVQIPGKRFNTSKFAPVIWTSLKQPSFGGEKTLMGLFPNATDERPDFGRADRVEIVDLQLTPRLIAQEELTVEFTLGVIKQKDYVAGVLKTVTGIAATPAAQFLSQIAPLAGTALNAAEAADQINDSLGALLDENKLQTLGRFVGTLRAPLRSGLVAFIDGADVGRNLRYDAASNTLVSDKGPVKSAYAVLRLKCEQTRPDWMTLPDLNQAWQRIRDTALNGGDLDAAVEYFRVTALTSPDLTRNDAERIVEAAHARFSGVLAGAESAEDPGGMEEALSFIEPRESLADQAESLTLALGPLAAAAAKVITPAGFKAALKVVLENEGGFVDHPNDPGGATNMGVTQKVYDAYRKRKGQPKRSVRDLETGELEEIYFQGYWRPAMCPEMPNDALSLLMFDAAVNHGPKNAIKLLQQACGVPAQACDGRWGPQTRAALMSAASDTLKLIEDCLFRREQFYRRLVEMNPSLGVFLRGWLNRIVHLRSRVKTIAPKTSRRDEPESFLLTVAGAPEPLVVADPDFSLWELPEPAAAH